MNDLWAIIIKQMESRRELGLKNYGVPVTADPKVNWRLHLEEELLDAVVYNRAAGEIEQKYDILVKAVRELLNETDVAEWHDNQFVIKLRTLINQ